MYIYGADLRYRYMEKLKFLSMEYNAKEVYAMSTNTPRAIMSGQAFMVGFYPEGTGPKIKESDLSEAVPPFEHSKVDPQDELF